MRQVPRASYTIIGDGRMARHFTHYLSLLNIPFEQWSRRNDPEAQELSTVINRSERLLLLISDSAIAEFVNRYDCRASKYVMHFSGCLTIPGVIGVHPPMTFTEHTYPLEDYQNIPFMIDDNTVDYQDLLPGLANPCFYIPPQDKAYYHALCVLSANFTCLLWQKMAREFKQRWQIPDIVLQPYLKKVTENICKDPESALTGPLVREDWHTVAMNQQALQGDPYAAVYQAFVQAYVESAKERGFLGV